MIVTIEEMRANRLNLVHQMHNFIMNTGDEEIYDIWSSLCIPDEPCEEDFKFFAYYPEEFKIMCHIFRNLLRKLNKKD